MSLLTDLLLNSLSSSLQALGESKLIEVLQKLHDKDVEKYRAAIFGGNALVKALLPVVATSATKIDDAIIKALDEAISLSAENNGIVL